MRTTAAWWCLLAAAVVATDPRADAQYRRAIELDPSNPLLVVETERHFVEAARALFPPLVKALNKYPAARSWSHLRRVQKAEAHGEKYHGGNQPLQALSVLRFDVATNRFQHVANGQNLHLERVKLVHAAVTEALAPGAEAHDAVNAFAAAEFRPGLAAGNYTKKLCGGRGSRPKAILLHTSDGAPPDAPETRAFWDLYRGPPCQYGHFVAFNLPSRLANSSCAHAWPSPYQLNRRANHNTRRAAFAGRNVSYGARDPQMMYRGAALWASSLFADQRADLVAIREPWLNASATNDIGGGNKTVHDHLTIEAMVRHRFLIDVGGLGGTSWDGLMWKMASGSVVFRVASDMQDWWHRKLQPWVHYVPVPYTRRGDLSRFRNALSRARYWALHNPQASKNMTRRAKRAALAARNASVVKACIRGILRLS